MNAEQLAETTMNPEKRTLLQVRPEDAVEGRRKFIADNALDVKNLDV
jgi:DNA gyrase subunit B